MNDSGQRQVSRSDLCHFWLKHLIAGVRLHRARIPSIMITVNVSGGGCSPCLGVGVEQKPLGGHVA